jgi:predicted XRE-type DNA-binding protein
MRTKRDYRMSSGNVFADLDFGRPEEALAKAELANRIVGILQKRRLTQMRAAQVLGVDQPKISALSRGHLEGFSIERLMRFLVLLGQDVEIRVKQRPRTRLEARLLVA